MKSNILHRLLVEDDGSGLAEYALIVPLFLALTLGVIEYSIIYYHWIMAEKATYHAVRLAVVRPPICAGLPTTNTRFDPSGTNRFGTTCLQAGGPSICASPADLTCVGNLANPTFQEIFADISPMLPAGTPANSVSIRYESADLGFLGGPYVPVISVELSNVQVDYLTPFANLLVVYGAQVVNFGTLTLPPVRATMSAEDLAMGPGA